MGQGSSIPLKAAIEADVEPQFWEDLVKMEGFYLKGTGERKEINVRYDKCVKLIERLHGEINKAGRPISVDAAEFGAGLADEMIIKGMALTADKRFIIDSKVGMTALARIREELGNVRTTALPGNLDWNIL